MFDALRGKGFKARLLHPVDELWDRRFGVHTVGFIPDHGAPDSLEWRGAYVPTQYRRIIAGLRHVGIGPDDVVVDLGCGLGRAVFAGSWLGAKRAVGVEIDAELVAQANRSLQRSRLKDRDIEFICTSAEEYSPTDMTILFMFNPFGAGTMQAVIKRLESELLQRPRHLRIVYENPLQYAVLDASSLLRRTGDWPPGKAGSRHPVAFWESVGSA